MLASQLMLNFTLLEVVSLLKANVKPPREPTGADVFYRRQNSDSTTIEHISHPHLL